MSDFDASYFETQYADYSGQNPPRKLRHYHAIIKRRLDDGPYRAIDVGCGLGLWAAHLADVEPAWSVVGMDVNPEVIEYNAARFPTVSFEAGRAGEGPQPQPFDVLTAMDVLEHVPDIETQFGKLCNWVRPGGLLAFVVPVYDGPLGPIVHLMDKDPTHLHKWGRDSWLTMAHARLSDVEWHGIFRLRVPGGYYAHWPAVRMRSVAPAIMVTGRVSLKA